MKIFKHIGLIFFIIFEICYLLFGILNINDIELGGLFYSLLLLSTILSIILYYKELIIFKVIVFLSYSIVLSADFIASNLDNEFYNMFLVFGATLIIPLLALVITKSKSVINTYLYDKVLKRRLFSIFTIPFIISLFFSIMYPITDGLTITLIVIGLCALIFNIYNVSYIIIIDK